MCVCASLCGYVFLSAVADGSQRYSKPLKPESGAIVKHLTLCLGNQPNAGFLAGKEVLLNADTPPSLKTCGLKLSFPNLVCDSLFPVLPYVGPRMKGFMTSKPCKQFTVYTSMYIRSLNV